MILTVSELVCHEAFVTLRGFACDYQRLCESVGSRYFHILISPRFARRVQESRSQAGTLNHTHLISALSNDWTAIACRIPRLSRQPPAAVQETRPTAARFLPASARLPWKQSFGRTLPSPESWRDLPKKPSLERACQAEPHQQDIKILTGLGASLREPGMDGGCKVLHARLSK